MTENIVEIRNLSKSFGDNTILDQISLTVKERDILGIAGISGAGKSTLLRCINRLETFDSGEIIVDGVSIGELEGKELREYQKSTGMVFQNFSLLERASVYENVALPMNCWGYSSEEIDKKVKELVDLVGLIDKLESKPRELSGGQKQRVAIARALTMNPKLLLCDEATSALDPNTADSILDLLNQINKNLGVTIIMVTHQMEVIKSIANKLVILRHGKLETKGNVEEIFLSRPEALMEVTGKSSEIELSNEGKNIEIVVDASEKTEIFFDIAKDIGVEYSVDWGGFDKYRDNIVGSFVINYSSEDHKTLAEYLDKYGIEWREL